MNIQGTDTLVSSRVVSIENVDNPIVAAAEQLFDYDLNKFLSEINKSTNDALAQLDNKYLSLSGGVVDGNLVATTISVKNGTSTQVLMADGSLKEWGSSSASDIESITNTLIDDLFS